MSEQNPAFQASSVRPTEVRSLKVSPGFTLVELLIGIFLSLFIGGMALTFMVSSSQSFRAQTNDAVSNENARFVLEQLSQYIRMAGWIQSPNSEAVSNVIVNQRLCPVDESAISDGDASRCSADNIAGGSDRLAVEFVIHNNVGTATTTLCNGNTVSSPAGSSLLLAHVFWTADLDVPADNTRSLYCQPLNLSANTPIGPAVPLVDGIDRLEVQYGVDSNGDQVIDQYQSYTNLVAADAGGLSNTRNVRAIRFAVLVNAGLADVGDSNIEQGGNKQYQLLDGPQVVFQNDRVFRQVYSSTVLIHNSL